MFAYIKGTVEQIHEDYIVVEKGDIGFKIMTSSNVTSKLSYGEKTTIHTYMNVREDDISLFGFLSTDELNVFKLLIGVSGIGPKGALAVMSALTVDEIRMAVLSEDHKAIAKANGVGPKTAQRVGRELKDKLKLDDVLESFGGGDDLPDINTNDIISEAAMALTSLGYSNVESLRAIKKVSNADKLSVEELIKAALKNMM